MSETNKDEDPAENGKKWKKEGKSKKGKFLILISVPTVLIAAGAWFYLQSDRYISTENAYIKADTTSISAEVTGRITEVEVRDNEPVKKGQLLLSIDPEPYEIAVESAKARLNATVVEIESLRSDYLKTLSELAVEEENVRFRKGENDRYQSLIGKQVISQEKLNQVEYDYNKALRERDSAKREVEVIRSKLGGDPDMDITEHPSYKQAKAELDRRELDLSRVKIFAPIDGIAANLSLDMGEYIIAGMPLFTIVEQHGQWIEANFKETDLTHMETGQLAEVEVDAYPGVKWQARVISITPATGAEFSILPAQNSSGNWVKVVQRIMVKFEILDTQNKPRLLSGMSTVITVDTGKTRLDRMMEKS
ncbi:MAG: HlyD family secretion protein [Kordiimonadaceae bacterium]|nr:HlyD family secretion protein [Kordiimonadaceae bacterium]